MLLTLLLSALRSLWLRLIEPNEAFDAEWEEAGNGPEEETAYTPKENEDTTVSEQIAAVVRQIMEEEEEQKRKAEAEDFELRRVVGLFKLLREEGYTLRIEPGTPEENAPVFDFEKEELIRPAA